MAKESFFFNFGVSEDGTLSSHPTAAATADPGAVECKSSKLIALPSQLKKVPKEYVDQLALDSSSSKIKKLKYISERWTLREAHTELKSVIASSDLVPGVYEGGYKVWEGSIDLVRFLASTSSSEWGISINTSSRVLEVGCGHGLPGIFALQHGAAVDFQDYVFSVYCIYLAHLCKE